MIRVNERRRRKRSCEVHARECLINDKKRKCLPFIACLNGFISAKNETPTDSEKIPRGIHEKYSDFQIIFWVSFYFDFEASN